MKHIKSVSWIMMLDKTARYWGYSEHEYDGIIYKTFGFYLFNVGYNVEYW